MGVVFEVSDRERGEVVAAKRLLRFEPAALYLFKQEFRTLADVRHPNLVRFYEFVQQGDGDPFFTMERVHGVDFLSYARAHADRLTDAVRQLVEGVRALHDAGKLHRDIKPSNVLVTEEGRVVLLDFGVATQIAHRFDSAPTPDGEFVGSAVYMAPEQADGGAPVAASDWYSVGTMIYEALVGHPPFSGRIDEVIAMKWNFDPERPSTKVPGVRSDLDELCMALLDRDPQKRPDAAEILRRLGKAPSTPPPPAGGTDAEAIFVGRTHLLDSLSRAFEKSSRGELVVVRISGEPGMGKSRLVQKFLANVERDTDTIVVRGRAYEREAVPYKALDGAIDTLSDRLVALEERGDLPSLPADVWALAQIFPVLRRVGAVAEMPAQPIGDPHEARARAFGALRELLATLAARAPLVVFLDDVHWGDIDSATLLLEIVRPPNPPPFLLFLTERVAEAKESAFCRAVTGRWPSGVSVERLAIGALEAADAEALALALLDSADPRSAEVARALAGEARGNPFLIEELVRGNRAAHSADGGTGSAISLGKIVAERLDRLPGEARAVLEAIAIAGHPVRSSVVAAACGQSSVEEIVALLVARRLARTGLRGRFEAVDVLHERIRDSMMSALDDATVRSTHAKLVRVLLDTPGIDAEEVAGHALGAGDRALAATFMERGGEQAFAGLAFDRAARLFRNAIDLLESSPADAARCRERLADTLKSAGRSEEAAQTYLAAAAEAAPGRRIELRRAAADQLMSGGYFERAREVLREVLAAVQMRAPRSTLTAVLWLLIYRAWLSVLGSRFREAPPGRVPAERNLRIDAIYIVVGGFSVFDPIVGACMQARHMIEALRGTDASRLLRALVMESAHSLSNGAPESKRERELLAAIEPLRERLGGEDKRFANHIRGLSCFHRGRWAEALALMNHEIDTLPYGHTGMGFIRVYAIFTDYYVGNLRRAFDRARQLLVQATDRGDLYTSVNLRTTVVPAAALADDDPEAARATLRAALESWTQTTFSVQHWHALLYEATTDLYDGRGDEGYVRIDREWRNLKRSLLMHGVAVRVPALFLRGTLAIASIAGHPDVAPQRIAEARRLASTLAKETDPWARVLVDLINAAADNASGDRSGAIARLRSALALADSTGTRVYSAPSRHRLGELLGGDEGRAAIDEATAELRAQGIRNPQRWVRIYLPGTWTAT
jgi:tetratricopeptide (TPR) repeat protein